MSRNVPYPPSDHKDRPLFNYLVRDMEFGVAHWLRVAYSFSQPLFADLEHNVLVPDLWARRI